HHAHMATLRAQQREAALLGSLAKDLVGFAVGAIAGQPQLAIGSWVDMVGQAAAQPAEDLAESQQEADAAYQEVVQARSHDLDLMACYHAADQQKFAIDEANDVIARTFHDVEGAIAGMDNAKTLANAAVGEARGELSTEVALDRTPPHHHYWLARDIADYQRHLAYARRLAYLALRAFEWESQQSLGLRTQVLTAQIPSDLGAVVTAIEGRNAPMQGENGVIGETPIVLSLRDEILRIEDLAHNPHRSPDDPPVTSEEAFRRLLTSDATKVYRDGVYLGHGVRFSLRPMPWSQTFCAERIWRITTALQIGALPDGGELNNPVLVLAQDNAFASQQCRATERGAMHVARVTPFRNLLVGDAPPAFTASPPDTPMSVDGLKSMTRASLEALPEGRHPGFAGRGVYGEYILLFPSEQFTPEWLSVVRDVLIRFDLVEVTNAPL
ncbi:MAG TPA: hypothetical protein VGD80_07415, partial [Kofleriaceae bacterium]